MWRRAAAASLMPLALGACSLLVSTSGLSGGADPPDAGAPETSDAAEVIDATDLPDAAPDAVDASVRFCERKAHTFCADFDDPSAPKLETVTTSGGNLSLDADAVSAPASSAYAVSSSSMRQRSARHYAALPSIPAKIRIELDAKLCELPASGFMEFLKLEVDNSFQAPSIGYGDAALTLAIEGKVPIAASFGYRQDGTKFEADYNLPTLPLETWRHYVIVATLANTGGALRVEIDGAVALELNDVATLTAGAQSARLLFGTYTNGVSSTCTNKIDNVTVDEL
ncbi:MAG: hypothetical protein KF819_17215 [Labilithrix sp.]|nr:hypothetical protein [Labilithrix sp.]